MIKFTQVLAISVVLLFAPAICTAKQEHLIQGRTMGTTYRVKIITGDNQGIGRLKDKIDARLVEINNSMSTYKKDSEISRFNEFKLTGQAFEISDDFLRVMRTARTIFELSEGAWDGTVNPLVDLWGFGRAGRQTHLPPKQQIAALLPDIGFDKIKVSDDGALVKKSQTITLDLSSVAKGYGVDAVAQIIHKAGFKDYLVEIGGEVFASGRRIDGKFDGDFTKYP